MCSTFILVASLRVEGHFFDLEFGKFNLENPVRILVHVGKGVFVLVVKFDLTPHQVVAEGNQLRDFFEFKLLV